MRQYTCVLEILQLVCQHFPPRNQKLSNIHSTFQISLNQHPKFLVPQSALLFFIHQRPLIQQLGLFRVFELLTMPHAENVLQRKSRNQLEQKYLDRNTEMDNSCGRLTFKGLSCKNIKCTYSSPVVIHSAAEWEDMRRRNRRHRKSKRSKNGKVVVNVVDVPDVCCTPPGIGSASDVAPRSRINRSNQLSRPERRTTLREAVAASNDHNRELLRSCHQSPRGTSEIVRLHDDPLYGGRLGIFDRERDWRLNVDNIYEQLLELGERIGYSSKGLQEEEILGCLTKLKHSTLESFPLLIPHTTYIRCSICQDEFTRDGEVSSLCCCHLYHTDCIKKWLLRKKTCPICRTAAVPRNKLK
ncbi:ubiquitin-protein ligase [Lithospermum erythrorhizon]|uniref:RING-type E3 ubiquitin transferase n=1 Tax=Lithospermum erythrorhizon TaxID=34254 RepID=A0AAV3NN47_LITER